MAQSDLYAGSAVGNTVDVTDDAGRNLGIVSTTGDVDVATPSPIDVSGAPVTVEDDGTFHVDSLPAVDVSKTDVVTASTSSVNDDASLVLGPYRQNVDWFVDVSGAATLTVEVRTDGGTWREFDVVEYTGATTEVEQYSTAFAEMRASVDANLNTLEGSGKGL
jgi:hypothetical protein